jgi:hypothetical protein
MWIDTENHDNNPHPPVVEYLAGSLEPPSCGRGLELAKGHPNLDMVGPLEQTGIESSSVVGLVLSYLKIDEGLPEGLTQTTHATY